MSPEAREYLKIRGHHGIKFLTAAWPPPPICDILPNMVILDTLITYILLHKDA